MPATVPPRVLGLDLCLALLLVATGATTWLLLHQPGVASAAVAVTVGAVVLGVALLSLWRRRHAVGPADRITLLRLSMTAICAVWTVLSVVEMAPIRAWWLFGLAALAALLDAFDGPIARRTGTTSAGGARFDMEADAALLMVLSLQVSLVVGPWALLIGGLRYLFLLAGRVVPRLRTPLPFSQARRVVAAGQAIALLIGLAPITPVPVAVAVVALATLALCWSFGRDVVWLLRAR